MKYIKLFENFTDNSDYNIDQIKEILKVRGTNFNDIEFIDSGGYGSVFDLKNGYVLKITTMDSELIYAEKLMNIDSNFLVKVKDVFYHAYHDVGYTIKIGFIVMEKLEIRKGNSLVNFIDSLNIYNSPKYRYRTISDEDVLKYFKYLSFFTDKQIIRYWNVYKNIALECEKYDLPIDDIRGGNIGFRDNHPVLFDIGDIYKSYEHDYSNIDIIYYDI